MLHIKSRDQLLQQSEDQPRTLNRTKIICSINEKTTQYDIIKSMVLAGADALRYFQKAISSVNSAYIQSRKQLKKISKIRNDLEQELGKTISLNLILKGNLTRVGDLQKPELLLHVATSVPRIERPNDSPHLIHPHHRRP
jgi:pyruvate kinase